MELSSYFESRPENPHNINTDPVPTLPQETQETQQPRDTDTSTSSPISLLKPQPEAEMRSKERSGGDLEQNRNLLDTSAQTKWTPTRLEKGVMATLSIISFMVALDATIIVTSLSTIVPALNASSTQGFWIGTSYLLVVAVTMPFTASISDIMGRPQTLTITLVSFAVGTILCAVSHGIGLMIVGRCLQGIGGGAVIILSQVIFSDIVPPRFRPQYFGIVQGAWALGTVVGPIIGGAFAAPSRWRWVFWVLLFPCGFGLVTVPWLVRLKRPEATLRESLHRVDWLGGFLFIGSATSLLIAISWGGTTYAWSHWRTLVPLIVGAIGLVATMVYERYGAGANAFLRHSLFHVWSAHIVYFLAFTNGVLLYSVLYYVPFYFESVKFYAPLRTGYSLLPALFTLVPASVIVGALITRTARYRWSIIIGWVLSTLAVGLMISWDRSTSTPAWAAELVILGFGLGLNLNALSTASQATSKTGDEGRAVGMYAFLRSFGMAVGVGVSGSVFQNVMKSKLRTLNLPTTIALSAEAYITILKAMPDSQQRKDIISAYVAGFHGVFGFITALSGIALIACLFIKHYEINKELVTEHKLSAERVSWRFSRGPAVAQTPSTLSVSPAESTDEHIVGERPPVLDPIALSTDVSAMQSRERVAERLDV